MTSQHEKAQTVLNRLFRAISNRFRTILKYQKSLKNKCYKTSIFQGDSGGPLVCLDERNRYVVSGVVSFGRSDCLSLPNVFTDVAHYHNWIYMNMLMNQ